MSHDVAAVFDIIRVVFGGPDLLSWGLSLA